MSNLLINVKNSMAARTEHYTKTFLVKLYRGLSKALPVWLRPFYIEEQHRNVYHKYVPDKFLGKVVLIRQPLEKKGIYSEHLLGWGGVLENLHVKFVEGNHAEMIEDEKVVTLISQLIGHL